MNSAIFQLEQRLKQLIKSQEYNDEELKELLNDKKVCSKRFKKMKQKSKKLKQH